MRNAPTLGAALRDFAKHLHRDAHGCVAYLLTNEDPAIFGYAIYHPRVEGYPLICDAAASLAFNIVRELAPLRPVHDIQLLLSRAEPQDLEPYDRFYGVRLHFNADQTAVLLPRAWLSRPVPGADAGLRSILEQRVKSLCLAGELDLITRLRRSLRVGLLTGQISRTALAAQLGLHPRTLHRRVHSLGTHFQEILDQTRCEFAQQLLANSRLGIKEIGLILRYSEPAAFTRAFIRWARVPPSEWRSSADSSRDPILRHSTARSNARAN